MKCKVVRITFSFATLLLSVAAVAPAQDAGICTSAGLAGDWGYTYTGTLILPTGAVPVASMGRFAVDAAGNLSGTQTSSLGGSVGEDKLAGTVTVNSNCTGALTIYISDQSGTLLRTGVLALVFVDNGREVRGIFTSLQLANGTKLATVITVNARKLVFDRGNAQ